MVVEAGGGERRRRSLQAKRSWSTIRWSISGVRFYQASYGRPVRSIVCVLNGDSCQNGAGKDRRLSLAMNQTVALDADTNSAVRGVYSRLRGPGRSRLYARNDSRRIQPCTWSMTSEKAGAPIVNVWLPAIPGFAENATSPYKIEAQRPEDWISSPACRFRMNPGSGQCGRA